MEASSAEAGLDGSVPDAEAWRSQCEAYWTPLCDAWKRCAPYAFKYYFASDAECVSNRAALCMQSLVAPGSDYDAAQFDKCITALGSPVSCELLLGFFWDNLVPAECVMKGTLGNNESCFYEGQCASSFCAVPLDSTACGTCQSPANADENCDAMTWCSAGLTCAGTGKCLVASKLGEPCSMAQPCQTAFACMAGKCTERVADGETCSPTVGNCLVYHNCNGQTKVCEPIKQQAQAGEDCGYLSDGSLEACVRDLRCRLVSTTTYWGVCEAYDGTCGAPNDYLGRTGCQADEKCVAGSCKPNSADTCGK